MRKASRQVNAKRKQRVCDMQSIATEEQRQKEKIIIPSGIKPLSYDIKKMALCSQRDQLFELYLQTLDYKEKWKNNKDKMISTATAQSKRQIMSIFDNTLNNLQKNLLELDKLICNNFYDDLYTHIKEIY